MDPDLGTGALLTPECGMEKIRIRDKHPGSATLLSGMIVKGKTLYLLENREQNVGRQVAGSMKAKGGWVSYWLLVTELNAGRFSDCVLVAWTQNVGG